MYKSVLFGVFLGVFLISVIPAIAEEDLCELVKDRVIAVNVNGFEGMTNQWEGLPLKKGADGTYTFDGSITFGNEPADKLSGTCKGRHITFKRTRAGANGFVQEYDGYIFEHGGNYRRMAGIMVHNGVKKVSWCGETKVPTPK